MAPPHRQYKDRKEQKTQEIKKALVHKARLKKSYFKLLEKEGQAVPEKRDARRTHDEAPAEKPRLTYQDRIRISKERKLELKKLSVEKLKEKLKSIEQANKKREQRKEKFSKKTKTGQPLMGPRISDLLEKIKETEK